MCASGGVLPTATLSCSRTYALLPARRTARPGLRHAKLLVAELRSRECCHSHRRRGGLQATACSSSADPGKGIPNRSQPLPLERDVQIDQLQAWFCHGRTFLLCSGILWMVWNGKASPAYGAVTAVDLAGKSRALLQGAWPKILQVLGMLKEQGLLLSVLLGLSAFFSMSETAITTLWPWKVRELAEKESEGGVFQLLRQDVTRFLTTILIGTTIANIAATALVTDAATALFGEAGVTAATGVMTVVVLLLTEIAPKSIAVHNATEVARFVVRPVAWLSVVLYPVGRIVTILSTAMLKFFGLKSSGEPFVTEEELKLMLRGAELSGAIEEEEQDMIENVLDIKDTYVREVMTPLVDVVAIDGGATLMEFRNFWVKHQYSRVPVFERRVDNIVGIAYAMDMLDYVEQSELLQKITVARVAHRPAYFVPDSMSVWNLLREFRIRKVHMAIVLNEYGGTVGIVTLEDVVEEIVGEIFDENDSKEEIRRKTGYVVQRAEGVFDVDANTSIEDLSEALQVKFPEEHHYETVSGFVCEAFGYIPRTGESVKVVLRKQDSEENQEGETENQEEKKEKFQTYKLEILAGNARKVGATRFEVLDSSKSNEDVARPLPRFVRRAWEEQCEANDSDKVAIIWDGKTVPCAKGDNELCSTEDSESEENGTNNAIEVVSSDVIEAVEWTVTSRDGENENETDIEELEPSNAMERYIDRRRQRRRKQALEATAELTRQRKLEIQRKKEAERTMLSSRKSVKNEKSGDTKDSF
ncbi:DUF21 domain-containing protein At1g55930, chloroplastic [Selaginella moellendorffii]|nr:DUF21 domain-containing protein At1g55930, chloroplastic [Selaginella moellendorffii]|eukprot:XP_002966928.2 DUF21 domain-containing protein At1g55930, chloroplastic [Selaginella moellendorffii]